MIVPCSYNDGSSLGAPHRGNFYTERTVFHLVVGKNYVVAGLGIFETVLLALVCDETGNPNWLPVGLFDFAGNSIPDDWEFALFDGVAASGGAAGHRWVARWGYRQLVRDPRHSDALIERDPHALAIYFAEVAKFSDESDC
ncbi:MAG TPA: hypothetical protein VGL75_05990 [Acidothermaceae bacterium]|jgi:hypothetical protein